jgi:Ribosome biogenesis protein SLX9
MPKVSRVGKFRNAAKTTVAETFLKPAAPAAAEDEPATTSSSLPTDYRGGDTTVVATMASSDPPKNGNDDAAQKSAVTDGGDSSSSSSSSKQQQNNKQQPALLSRGQRKRMAKRDQYLKREQMVLSSLELKRQDEQKKRIDGLDAMKSALMDTIRLHSSKQAGEEKNTVVKTNKARQRLVGPEVAQMTLVLQHPSFQADPFATIRQHLKNTIPPPAASAATVDHRKAKRDEKRAVKKKCEDVKRKRHNKKRARPTRSKAR